GAPFDVKTAFEGVFADPAAFNRRMHVLFLSIGTAEAPRMQDGVRGFRAALDKADIKTVFYESPGTDHEWLTWRRSLHEFAPLLFNAQGGGQALNFGLGNLDTFAWVGGFSSAPKRSTSEG